MVSDELLTIINMLNIKGKMRFKEGASEEEVARFEIKQGVHLPEEFKKWLLFSDGGECFLPGGIQLYGVAHKPLIDISDNNRPNENYYVIGALATGDPILCEKAGEKIAIYNQEANQIEDDEVYSGFFAFLKDLPFLLGIEE